MKKIFAVLVAVVMIFSFSAVAFAANDGVITVEGATNGQRYTAYRIFDLVSYDKDAGTYNYKVNADWEDFANDPAIKDIFVSIDPTTQAVTWCAEANVKEFAKLAKEYVEANGIGGIKSAVAANDVATISGLALGYYLVDSTVGSICALDTTDPAVTVMDKNEQPTIEKEVKEDSTGEWGDENTAGIGETVNYKVTITKHDGSKNYVMHDNMDKGLTFDAASVVLTCGEYTLVAGTDYTLTVPGDTVTPVDGDPYRETFKIAVANEYINSLEDGAEIVVTYNAVVNADAVIAPASNDNEVFLKYGDNNDLTTEPDSTKTFTYEFDLVKTNSSNVVLDGAEFLLWADADKTTAIPVVLDGDVYRPALEGETGAVIVAGNVTVKGLDAGSYYLEETKAPTGFNKLDELTEVVIVDANLEAAVEVHGEVTNYVSGGVQVINNSGAELPSTGGMGTTMFYIVGIVMIAGAAIVLFSKKRMAYAA